MEHLRENWTRYVAIILLIAYVSSVIHLVMDIGFWTVLAIHVVVFFMVIMMMMPKISELQDTHSTTLDLVVRNAELIAKLLDKLKD